MSAVEDGKEFVLTDEHVSKICNMYEHWTWCESTDRRFSRTCIKFNEKIIDGYDCLNVAEPMQEVFEKLGWAYDKKYNWSLETVHHGQPHALDGREEIL